MHLRLLGFLLPLFLTGVSNDETLCVSVQEQHAGPSEAARAAEEEQWLSGVRLPVQLGLHVRSDRPAGPTEAYLGLWETSRVITDVPLAGGTVSHIVVPRDVIFCRKQPSFTLMKILMTKSTTQKPTEWKT